jgi:hypothetical protein
MKNGNGWTLKGKIDSITESGTFTVAFDSLGESLILEINDQDKAPSVGDEYVMNIYRKLTIDEYMAHVVRIMRESNCPPLDKL